jgi:hypothetical protein
MVTGPPALRASTRAQWISLCSPAQPCHTASYEHAAMRKSLHGMMLTQRGCRICRGQLGGVFIRAGAIASRSQSSLAGLQLDGARLPCGRANGSIASTLQETQQLCVASTYAASWSLPIMRKHANASSVQTLCFDPHLQLVIISRAAVQPGTRTSSGLCRCTRRRSLLQTGLRKVHVSPYRYRTCKMLQACVKTGPAVSGAPW